MGFILATIATIILWAILPLAILWALVKSVFGSTKLEKYFYEVAFSIDQTGNVICSPLFNSLLKKKNGYSFGNPDETVSHVLGVNKLQGTLTIIGKIVAGILNLIEKNHVENAAKNEQ